MKRSNRLVILVGVLLAVLAFVAIVVLLNQRADVVPEEVARETVVVATRDIEIGESVTPELVEEQEVDPEAVAGTAIRSASQLTGRTALFPIPQGSQVTGEAIGQGMDPTVDIAGQLRPGEKAVAFQVDRTTGLDFLIKPGDTIDIVISMQMLPELEPDPETVRTVKTVIQNRRVLYVSDSRAIPRTPPDADADGDGQPDEAQAPPVPIENVIVVIAGTDQDAEIIRFAQRTDTDTGDDNTDTVAGSLSVVIRSTGDETVEETTGVTIDQLIADYGLLIPNLEELLEAIQPDEEPTDETP